MADNFRHAQYRGDGTQIDDPQKIGDLTTAQVSAVQALVSGAWNGRLKYGSVGDSRIGQEQSTSATSYVIYDEGFTSLANQFAGLPFAFVGAKGVGGNTLVQILARIPTDIDPLDPAVVVVMGSINDFLSAELTGKSPAVVVPIVYARALAIVQALQAKGRLVIFCTEAWLGTANANNIASIKNYNEALLTNFPAMGVRVFPYHQVAIDAAGAARNPSTFWRDGTTTGHLPLHFNNGGAVYIAKALAPYLTAINPRRYWQVVGNEDWSTQNYSGGAAYSNVLDNPTLQGTSGTNSTAGAIAGNVPTGWELRIVSGSPTGTCALVAVNDPDTGLPIRNRFVVTFTTFPAGAEVEMRQSVLGRVAAGMYISAQGIVTLTSPANIAQAQIWATSDAGGGGQTVVGTSGASSYTNSAAVQPMVAGTYYRETLPFPKTPGAVAERFQARIKTLSTGAGDGTVWSLEGLRYRVSAAA